MRIESPKRSSHTTTLSLDASPEKVFPLFSPVLEAEWTPNWDPTLVISSSGMAEEACIFITPSSPHNAIWVVTRLDPDNHFVELLSVTPDHTVGKFEIQLKVKDGNRTDVTIACTTTALGPDGEAFVNQLTRKRYEEFMRCWEKALNHYLATGETPPRYRDLLTCPHSPII